MKNKEYIKEEYIKMKKLIVTFVTLTLLITMMIPFASPVYADSSGLVAGNDITDRSHGPDSWVNFYIVDLCGQNQ